MRTFTVMIVMLVAGVYLLNPTAGLLELIPDNFPIIGNLDELAAVTLLLGGLRYFGIDLTSLFAKRTPER